MNSIPTNASPHSNGFAIDATGRDCVRAVCMYFEKTVDVDWLRREFVDEDGHFSFMSVVRCLKALGFSVNLKKTSSRQLSSASFPSIVQFKDGKFAIVGRVADGSAYLQVPGEATPYKLDLSRLEELLSDRWIVVGKESSTWVSEKFGIAWFLRALLRYKGLLAETLMASFALQIFALASPFAFQVVIDKVLVHKGLSTLDVIVLGLAITSLFEVLLTALRTYVLTHTTNRVDAELGAKIFKHLISLPMTYFASRKVGEVVARVREMDAIRAFFTGTGLTSGVDLLFTVFFLAVMAYYSPMLTLVVIACLPFFLAISIIFIPLLNRYVEDKFVKAAENQAFLVESIAGVETIKSLTAENRFQRQWEERLADYVRSNFKTGHLANITQQGVQLVNKVMSLLLLWLGAKLVLAGDLTVGQLIAFNMLSARVNAPILRLSTLWQEFQQMRVSLRRLSDILDSPSEAPSSASLSLAPLMGSVSFENISFKYRDDGREILRDVSLNISPGELVGIVGSSGSGKSTLAKLLLSLYVPSKGRILLDGGDISGINPALIRTQVSVVTQDVTLFSKSVRENISIGRLDASLEEIVAAAEMAGADEFIRKLPRGYDTILGERGSNISGGQRQRIAIARAILMDPRVLILDEATSMLDADTEMRFWGKIRTISDRRTVVAITHRLSTVLDMDRIVVLEDGVVVEEGVPKVLLKQNGRFRKLYQLQMGLGDKFAEMV